MCYPISPIVINLFVEEFETEVINTASNPLRLWLRYLDDTFVIQKTDHSHQVLQHINSIDLRMQFTTETPMSDRSIPFLDTLFLRGPGNTLFTTVYGKPTNTDHYLHFAWCLILTFKSNPKYSTQAHNNSINNNKTNRYIHMVAPYTSELSEVSKTFVVKWES